MANPTTNYGWPMPTSADLVTDLPADFALFGQPVDTSLKALNPETTLGDIAYRSSTSNTNTRLGIGTNGQVLAVSGGVPAWTTTADVTPLTTKGDLFTFTTVDARIGIGANNTILTADSAEATGMKWATPAGAASLNYTLLNAGGTALTGATAITISGITSKALNIYVAQGGSVNASTEITLKPNNENNASLIYYNLTNTTPGAPGETNTIYLAQTGNNSLNEMIAQCNITSCDSAGRKPVISFGAGQGTGNYSYQINGTYNGSAITSIVLNSSSGNFDEGTIYVYGGS
jgi:hypothetical protein